MNESLYDLLALYVTQQSITNVSVTFVRMITERNDYFIIFFGGLVVVVVVQQLPGQRAKRPSAWKFRFNQ